MWRSDSELSSHLRGMNICLWSCSWFDQVLRSKDKTRWRGDILKAELRFWMEEEKRTATIMQKSTPWTQGIHSPQVSFSWLGQETLQSLSPFITALAEIFIDESQPLKQRQDLECPPCWTQELKGTAHFDLLEIVWTQEHNIEEKWIHLPFEVHIVKGMVFPAVMYGCENWTVKKTEHQRIDAFEL